ncbi:MAG: DNA primase [Fimbriimonadales bacterium]|nr:DNA primase [Fimbriimonadales bacterium]
MHDDVEQVRTRIDIVDLVGERVQLKRSGSSWRGLCPFHTEKTPSFHVNPQRGRYTCFGCQATGDVFDWVMRTENVDFRGALEILAARAGITLSKKSGPSSDNVERILDALEFAAKHFQRELLRNPLALHYAHSRGLDETTIGAWEIGFAPEDAESLPAALKSGGIRLEDAAAGGLLSGSPSEGYLPFFRGRLMFPIRNDKGRVVAFGARAFGNDEPKYLNSRDTIVFNKSQTLYGLHLAKKPLMGLRSIVITEGYLDVIACHRSGIETAVAPLGTAMNERHVEAIRRWADRVTLLYDSDSAGRKAARRANALLSPAGLQVRLGVLPIGADPDSLFSSQGAVALREVVDAAVSPLRFEVVALRQELGESSEDFWKEAKSVLASSNDILERDQLIAELAATHSNARFGLQAAIDALRKEVESLTPSRKRKQSQIDSNDSLIELPAAAERMVLRSALRTELREEAIEALADDGLIVTLPGIELKSALLSVLDTQPELDAGEILQSIPEESRSMFASMERPSEGPVTEQALKESIQRLRREREIRLKKAALERSMSDEDLVEYFRLKGRS